MSAAREKDRADFDLERFVDMFDEALISRDPRVMDALRGLMMMVTLTRPESRDSVLHDRNTGPLRRLYEDVNNLNRRMHHMEDELRQIRNVYPNDAKYPYEKFAAQAAKQMSDDIDKDLLNQLRQTSININGGAIKGLYKK
jgi:hypothetical protein